VKYKVLNQQSFAIGDYSLVPIRLEDRYKIMKWRNEQMYHLRQSKPLTKVEQEKYFEEVVSTLFQQEKPNQILFSYLHDEKCIGYGGLVHINWVDLNAEISFIMDTALEKEHFSTHWKIFLSLIEQVAFQQLKIKKVYVYAFDLRPILYKVLEEEGYLQEARLKKHKYLGDRFLDIVIHAKINQK